MTEDKKPTDEFGDIDWNEALSEWETTSFDPEVAKDVATSKPAALAGAHRPLYRPPTPAAQHKRKLVLPTPMMNPSSNREGADDEFDGGDATRIARMPDELLRLQEATVLASPDDELFQRFEAPTRPPQAAEPPSPETAPPPPESHRPVDEIHRPPTRSAEIGASLRPLASAPALVEEEAQYDPNQEEPEEALGDAKPWRSSTPLELLEQGPEGPSDSPSATIPPSGSVRPIETRTWTNEKPASEWLSPSARDELEERASWLEHEAQALGDGRARALALLTCSELFAMVGRRERAQALAAESRDLNPSMALAHRQARALMPVSMTDREDFVQALDAETNLASDGPAQVHSTWLAAEALRVAGQHDSAVNRLESAARAARSDARTAVARATRALNSDTPSEAAQTLQDAPEIAAVSEAVAICLRLRGIGLDFSPHGARGVAPPNEGTANRERAPAESLGLARHALDAGDISAAAPLVAELAKVPELYAAAKWLAAMLGATRADRREDSARWLGDLADQGDEEARRALIARKIELGQVERFAQAVGHAEGLTAPERMTLTALAGVPVAATDPVLDEAASTPGMPVLAAAVAAISVPSGRDREAEGLARARRAVGSSNARALVRLGRLLAASAPNTEIEAALENIAGAPVGLRPIGLEMAVLGGRTSEVCDALQVWGAGWGSREEGAIGALAAAIVSERAGDRVRALDAFKAARTADPANEASLRAVASLGQVDIVAEMNEFADDLGEGPRAAIARLEAVARSEGILPEPTRAHLLDRAHSAAPSLPMASFLAERIARRAGDIDELIRWIREHRAGTSDPVERALDAVREALLVADREPALAGERLEEAHRAHPGDMALRELYERVGAESAHARASWREHRSAACSGEARALLLLDAAREYERAGDEEGALRCAEAAGAIDAFLGRVARERSELRARRGARLTEELLGIAKEAAEPSQRIEAYERLATLDATLQQDPASSMLWHRTILEERPEHLRSLRYVEEHLIGEGRGDELEPVATALARVLRGTGAECSAHAELAVHLHLRTPDARWDETRELVEIAASEVDPSLWALRMRQAHARARGDDATFLAATLPLLERTSRPSEVVALLILSGEAALRLGQLEQARALLERATREDPQDVFGWTLLADVCRRAGDHRTAAESYEALARATKSREHRLEAWNEAGKIWLDDAGEAERAITAFEEAAAIDVGHGDVFDRLSRAYAERRMHPRLAALIERRIARVTEPSRRALLQLHRGQVLLEAGDTDGARGAFEAAIEDEPEDGEALSALADLCASQQDWPATEQALVRLAHLLPTAEEQRAVYARLGDLYGNQLLNLPRAEIALREVLKRSPDDADAIEKLIFVHRRLGDAASAAELQQHLVGKARSPEEKRRRVLELSAIHEQTAHDHRRAEQTLEAARREFPQDVGVLRALAEFYARHHQTPAVHILLDRASGDARRALAAGRLSPALFDVLATVFDLRDNPQAASIARAIRAALDGQAAAIPASGHRAFDPRLDDRLAPEGLSLPLRTLLAKAGDALDQVSPVDLRALRASSLPDDAPLSRLANNIAMAIGLGPMQVLVSPKLGAECIPAGSSPPAIVIGQALVGTESSAAFMVLRAIKLVSAKASVLARLASADLAILVSAWLKCFNPTWQPQGVNMALVNAMGGRLQPALHRLRGPEIAIIALEAAGTVAAQAGALGPLSIAWADRVALLGLGDPNAALDAIAASGETAVGAPRDPQERAAWIARTPEARDLVAFAVTDAFAEVSAQLAAFGRPA